ncbi:MAG: sodium/proline symporter [Candidatus Ventricola sp.]|nr:sodium/proline symporter [Candidatus Ventricola sp.]
MNTSRMIIALTMALYLVMTIGVGVAFSRRGASSTSDFYLGGRKLGPLVTAMSAEASDMSSYLLMGLPGLAYLAGLAEVSWTIIGLAVGTYLNFLLVSKRLRVYSEHLGAITVPDYFSRRYGDKRHLLSLIAALVIIVFFVPYTASGFKAVGMLFGSLFGWDYHVSMLIGAAVIIGYTVLGGFLAVSTTDLIQSVFMTVALVIIVLFGVNLAGGMDAVLANARALPGYLDLTKGYNWAAGTAGSFGTLSIVSTLAWGLGYFGMPHILLRFMAIRDKDEIKTSRRIATVWVVVSMCVAVLIGVIGYSISAAGIIPMLGTSVESETVIVRLADVMSSHGVLFAVVAGVILAGILAATMSTADSQLLAAASSVSQDIAVEFLGIRLSEKKSLLVARLTVVGIALVGLVLAWNPDSSVFRVVSFAWAGFGAAFGPVMLLSLFWKRSNRAGAIAGMITGGAMVFLWKYGLAPLGGVFAIYELLPAFIAALLVNVAVSLATPAPDADIVRRYEEVSAASRG